MKNIFNTMAFTVMFCAMSCGMLEEKNTTYATRDYYNSPERIMSGLNGCYDPVRSIYTSNFFLMTEASTDIIFLSAYTRPDANCVISPSKPGFGATVWRQGYIGVMRTNEMCDVTTYALSKGYIAQDEYRRLYGEAVTMRAMYYYVLTSTFGGVPFYTEAVTEENREQIAHLGRTPANEIRDILANELLDILLPASYGGQQYMSLARSFDEGTDFHAGAALGLMLAGKFCMWNERWDDAIKAFSAIEDIYGHYVESPEQFGADYPLTDIPFGKKFTRESIFEISNNVKEFGAQEYYTLAAYTTPSRSTTEIEDDDDINADAGRISNIYDGLRIPEMSANARTYKAARPTKYFYSELQPYTGADLRSGEYSAGAENPRCGSGNMAWRWPGYDKDDSTLKDYSVKWFSSCTKSTSRPWLGNKFWCPDMHYYRDSNNPKVFRYAGAILNMAEAQLMAGDADLACRYLNIIRVRAGLPRTSAEVFSYSTDDILEEIRRECARELFGEFQRKFDLVRWGIWYERALEYSNSGYLPSYIRPWHRYYPI
ncbi:MAG: RagB/SusD family nutrient uptake outer membrane protein, partial [Clostridium sp.]|nr:RagB/SusD family nutrient uptake outer membrane protein [Clostridium sp.]